MPGEPSSISCVILGVRVSGNRSGSHRLFSSLSFSNKTDGLDREGLAAGDFD